MNRLPKVASPPVSSSVTNSGQTLTISQVLFEKDQLSPFTRQVRLSAIKGLSRWVVDHHDQLAGSSKLALDREQLDSLRGIRSYPLPTG